MTLADKIIRDLVAGQSTADSIAERLEAREPAVMANLKRLHDQGVVISTTIMDGALTVWRHIPKSTNQP